MAQIFPIDFEEKLTMAQDDYILFSDSEDGNKIKKAQYKNLKGEPGTPGTPGQDGEDGAAATITVGSTTTGVPGSSASVTNSGTSSAAILDFTIPQGAKGETGAGATVAIGTTTTLPAGSSATVTNSGTSTNAVLNFGIPKGDSGTGSGDVNGPASSTDGDVAIFDGATGKLIKDGSVALSTLSSGASLAATAMQPGDDISDLNNDSGFITSSYHDSTKQDVLTAGTNIQISNNVISATGGSDIVYATQAEYNALLPGAESDNKHYFIYTESGGGGWQPGVNTLLYFPLVSDAVDTVNNVTLTSYGTTNYTEVGGVTSAEFTKSNYLYNDSVNVIPQGDVAKTFSVWAYIKGHNSSWTAILSAGGAGAGETFGLGQYENDNDIVMSRSYSTSNRYTPTLNTWTNFVMTYDNSVWTLYVNGQSQVTWNTTAPTSGNSFRISQHIGQTGALIYTFYGNLSNVILEDKERTAQEVSDYFNQTKANYGIS